MKILAWKLGNSWQTSFFKIFLKRSRISVADRKFYFSTSVEKIQRHFLKLFSFPNKKFFTFFFAELSFPKNFIFFSLGRKGFPEFPTMLEGFMGNQQHCLAENFSPWKRFFPISERYETSWDKTSLFFPSRGLRRLIICFQFRWSQKEGPKDFYLLVLVLK